jgi:hypothetical protein
MNALQCQVRHELLCGLNRFGLLTPKSCVSVTVDYGDVIMVIVHGQTIVSDSFRCTNEGIHGRHFAQLRILLLCLARDLEFGIYK